MHCKLGFHIFSAYFSVVAYNFQKKKVLCTDDRGCIVRKLEDMKNQVKSGKGIPLEKFQNYKKEVDIRFPNDDDIQTKLIELEFTLRLQEISEIEQKPALTLSEVDEEKLRSSILWLDVLTLYDKTPMKYKQEFKDHLEKELLPLTQKTNNITLKETAEETLGFLKRRLVLEKRPSLSQFLKYYFFKK